MFSIRAKQRPIPSISASNPSKFQFYICFRSLRQDILSVIHNKCITRADSSLLIFVNDKPHILQLLQLLQLSLQPTSTKVLINASPTCLRQHPSLFFQDSSRNVNDASAYRTAIVYSHISTCKAANVAPNMDGGHPWKEPILTAESGRTPALQPKKNK